MYMLKDRNLQKRLDEISDNDFTDQLLREINKQVALNYGYSINKDYIIVHFGRIISIEECRKVSSKFRVYFGPGEIENVPEYNPNDWNNWPDTVPPQKVFMKIECSNGDIMYAQYYVTENMGGQWISPKGHYYSRRTVARFRRFRPRD